MSRFSVFRYATACLLSTVPFITQAESSAASNAFNPAISVILSGTYAQFSNDPSTYSISGFALSDEVGPGTEGFGLGESELSMAANVDDQYYGRFTVSFDSENAASVEEAFVGTNGLGDGFTALAGRFLSGIGYLNNKHSHVWDFYDQPLVYRAMLGDQLKDDGVQVRWLAPTDLFMEFGAEALRGNQFPAGGDANSGRGTTAFYVHFGGDYNESNSWTAGVSYLNAKSSNRTDSSGGAFTGTTDITIFDYVWKWAPEGNITQKNFTLQAEYFLQSLNGSYTGLPLDSNQDGYYIQGVYQFIPRWRVGLRYDHLHADNPGAAFNGTALDTQGYDPHRWSVMVDFSRTEFSRFRVQYNQDHSSPTVDNEVYLQYIMALGAHGAHSY